MSTEKKKRINKLRKKRIWPSIVMFVVFNIALAAAVFVLAEVFITYTISSRVIEASKNTGHLTQLIYDRRDEADGYEGALNYLKDRNLFDGAMAVTDGQNQIVASIGDDIINTGSSFKVTFDDEYVIYVDDVLYGLLGEDGDDFGIEAMSILEAVMRGDFNESFDLTVWNSNPIGDTGMSLLTRNAIGIRSGDIIFLIVIIAVLCLVFSIPVLVSFINVITSIVSQRKITKLFYTDMVTGGHNWAYFEAAGQKLIRKRKAGHNYVMLDVKLLKYRSYVACHGNAEGEELLERIDRVINSFLGKKELAAHNAFADFGVLMVCNSQDECIARINTMLPALKAIGGQHRFIYHIGVQFINSDYPYPVDVNNLYSNAAAAAASLGDSNTAEYAFFNENLLCEQLWEHRVEDKMETALIREEFKVYLQPKYSPVDEELVGAEALVRWISPSDGFIAPNRFIPIFEENGFITKLDDYMIAHVAALQSMWIAQGKKIVPISVNVSRAHFLHDDLAEHICSIVDAYGTPHECIELELTESAFFDDKEMLLSTVSKLKQYGFSISMDDFGSGYSSLNSLKELPLDILKLDAEFFRGENKEERGEIVVSEAIRLAKQLNMKIVAEGIEKREQVDFLASQGCDMIQGYYFAKPMPVADFEQRI